MNNYIWFSIGLLVVGLILFFIQIFINYYKKPHIHKDENIEHYEEQRDKFSLRELVDVSTDFSDSSFSILTSMATGFVCFAIIIGVGSVVLANFSGALNQSYNTSEINTTTDYASLLEVTSIMSCFPLIIVFVIGMIMIGFIFIEQEIEEGEDDEQS